MQLEKNIEIPKRYKNSDFPFDTMEIGDSFFVPFEDLLTTRWHVSVWNKKAENGKRIVVRKMKDGEHRCWRIA